jgi:hypothetical protein
MPKDPKRNIQSYQLRGGDLNEFEFQKSQSEMAEEPALPFTDETDKPNLPQTKGVAEVTAEARRKVEKRKKRGLAKAGARQSVAVGKRSAKKVARKLAKKTKTRAVTKKRASVKSKTRKAATRRRS